MKNAKGWRLTDGKGGKRHDEYRDGVAAASEEADDGVVDIVDIAYDNDNDDEKGEREGEGGGGEVDGKEEEEEGDGRNFYYDVVF